MSMSLSWFVLWIAVSVYNQYTASGTRNGVRAAALRRLKATQTAGLARVRHDTTRRRYTQLWDVSSTYLVP